MAGPRDLRAHGELAELAAIEALGALDPGDRAELAAHLRAGCAPCLAALGEGRCVVVLLAAGAQPALPSQRLRARVLDAPVEPSARRTGTPGRRSRAPLAWLASAAALLLSVATGALWQDARLREQGLASLIATIEAPATHVVSLSASPGDVPASARAFVGADGRIALLVRGLPPPPAGRTYQLWLIEGGVPASAGTFATGSSGGTRHALATSAPRSEGFVLAVTLEPAGGVPAPTGPIVLAQR